jgi:hypothetical protein
MADLVPHVGLLVFDVKVSVAGAAGTAALSDFTASGAFTLSGSLVVLAIACCCCFRTRRNMEEKEQ